MVKIVWTELSISDLKEIFDYIADDSVRSRKEMQSSFLFSSCLKEKESDERADEFWFQLTFGIKAQGTKSVFC